VVVVIESASTTEKLAVIWVDQMPKIPDCDRCRFCNHSAHLICAVLPNGPDEDTCPYFSLDPDAPEQELWEPEGATYYNGELILQPKQYWTLEEQLELLDTHPVFTGSCPECRYQYSKIVPPKIYWDCPNCGWCDDSV
jgi:hypothetical protein